MKPAAIDFETFSTAGYWYDDTRGRWRPINTSPPYGLGAVGTWVYAQHPSTELLSLAYDMRDGRGVRLWTPADPYPDALFDHIRNGGVVEAWNVAFERAIWQFVCIERMGWPHWPLEQSRDAMARSYAHSLPGSLRQASVALGVPTPKQTEGTRLINKFSIPQNPTKAEPDRRRIRPVDDPIDGSLLYGYNIGDVVTHTQIGDRIPELSAAELDVWFLDQQINARGVHVDREALNDCLEIVQQATVRYNAELDTITGGIVTAASERDKIVQWLADNGLSLPNLQKQTVQDTLGRSDLNGPIRRVLEIRAVLGSQSVKKLYAIDRMIDRDGRLKGLFAYHGADRTGRFAGRGPQPQNLPSGGPVKPWEYKQVVQALKTISMRDLDLVERQWGDAVKTVSGCLRGLFSAAPGYDLICSDYSAIEAVVLAELAGERWRQDVFRTHGKIYEMTASRITGIPFEQINKSHPARKLGKVAELASGYSGWIGAWKNFGADEHFNDDRDIKDAILRWRADSPAIVEFWGGQIRQNGCDEMYGVEGAAISAVLSPGQCYSYRSITYGVQNDVLYCLLPSGRRLTYHAPRLTTVEHRYHRRPIYQLSYMGFNSNYKLGPRGWMRLQTYGGKLTENIVQAVARDILVHGMVELDRAGYPIVLHVHDEIVAEVPTGFGSIEEFERLMSKMPPWAHGWPVFARGGWRGQRYRKD
jgi:DNA polymerase